MTFLAIVLALLSVPVLAACGYLGLLTILSRRGPLPLPLAPHLRFDIVVPAHDESNGIGATVASLLAVDYPRDLVRVVVVADNCTDDTADKARRAGAIVIVRDDRTQIGKGYALALAFDELARGPADAIVVVDADTLVSPKLLSAFSARLDAGAVAVQANYMVRNTTKSWRTRLVAIAFAMFHELRSVARERLGVSCGLRGNGMCFTKALVREVPYRAFSVVEDVEYGIELGEAGHAVHFAREARVYGEVAPTERTLRAQRARWEGGRSRLARAFVPRLLARAWRDRSLVCFDLALDLLVPPIAILFAVIALGLGASVGASLAMHHATVALWLWGACAASLAAYGLRGWQLSGTGARGLLDLCWVPVFVIWKLTLRLRRSWRATEWIRSTRENEAP